MGVTKTSNEVDRVTFPAVTLYLAARTTVKTCTFREIRRSQSRGLVKEIRSVRIKDETTTTRKT